MTRSSYSALSSRSSLLSRFASLTALTVLLSTLLGGAQADFVHAAGSGSVSPIGYVHTLYRQSFNEISANYKSEQHSEHQ